MKRPRTSTLAAWGAAGSAALLLGAGAISASAATTAPSPGTSSSSPQTGAHHGARDHDKDGERHALHGEFVTGTTGAYVTRVVQQGKVTAVSPTSISVASADGFTQTYVVGAATRVRVNGADAKIADVTVGEPVHLGGTKDGTTVTAKRIGAGDPPARKGKGGHGPHGAGAPAGDAPAGSAPAAS